MDDLKYDCVLYAIVTNNDHSFVGKVCSVFKHQ